MAISIPSTDLQHTAMNNAIANIAAEITNVGSANGQLAQKLAADKVQAQHNLLLSLLGSGKVSAAMLLGVATHASGPAIS